MIRNTLKVFILILALISLCLNLFAQASEIRGVVKDPNGALIAGASVTLRNKQTGLERTIQTNLQGEFRFSGLSDGGYEIIVTASGFKKASITYQNQPQIEITLEVAPFEMATTVYSGSRQEELRESLNTKVDVITRTQIRDTGYETVGEVLRELPGVLTRRGSEVGFSFNSAGQQIQGIGSRQSLVLIDGFPIINARGIKSGIINLDRQSTARIEQIEVVKGAASALYGSDAIGGVINLITREPKKPLEASVTVSGGNFGRFDPRAEFGFRKKGWVGFFSLERHKNNGFDLTPTTPDTTGAGFHRYDLFGKLKYEFSENLYLVGFGDIKRTNVKGISLGEAGYQQDDVDETLQSYGLTANWNITPRTVAQLRGYFSRYDEIGKIFVLPNRTFPRGTSFPDENLFQRFGRIDASILHILGERQILQFGVEWNTDRYAGFNRLRNASGERADTSVVWGQDKISLTNWLTLTLGFRFDNHSIFGSAVSPKVGLNIRATERISLRASWGRGFRAPDLGQLYYRLYNPTNLYQVFGNPNLAPEHSGSWQLGAEYSSTRKTYRFSINFFRNDVRNLIEATNFGFVRTQAQASAILRQLGLNPSDYAVSLNRLMLIYTNSSNIFTQGIELDAEVKLPKDFAISGAYTYLDARNKLTGAYLPDRNKHQGFIKLAYDNAKLRFRTNIRGTFLSRWNVGSVRGFTGNVVAPGFQLWDFYVAKTYKNLDFFTAIDNIFNNRDPNVGKLDQTGQPLPIYRNEAGRTYRLGLQVKIK
ncbi:MAG: TonB-dependent receptor [Pyrinomonadaceae bacterium]|nr:TonB-dependent receptor [Pyrinomonadaceae bacterium]MCX7640194.1 TonB-dependent receptor [Pyrinomonadaceae bacterium]MDW8303218.1 TonB-dependent receptor [Acidobacteriota bacterium]